ncbi:hypothetical protein L249_8202 [Ophiocordyceps polyrhachis-furcata BCC 54312]|uniref:Uncharacterized protein n=1 Tax=Ophiocordyceps polyrhachis-furcata BCC 54312 TaxID=1330021 RepID=A0A367LHM5_9HYPO|nr:hypothetical protein L249_8202 [Ophiocordyceps polyrhachis-furcata BCC 54312]
MDDGYHRHESDRAHLLVLPALGPGWAQVGGYTLGLGSIALHHFAFVHVADTTKQTVDSSSSFVFLPQERLPVHLRIPARCSSLTPHSSFSGRCWVRMPPANRSPTRHTAGPALQAWTSGDALRPVIVACLSRPWCAAEWLDQVIHLSWARLPSSRWVYLVVHGSLIGDDPRK